MVPSGKFLGFISFYRPHLNIGFDIADGGDILLGHFQRTLLDISRCRLLMSAASMLNSVIVSGLSNTLSISRHFAPPSIMTLLFEYMRRDISLMSPGCIAADAYYSNVAATASTLYRYAAAAASRNVISRALDEDIYGPFVLLRDFREALIAAGHIICHVPRRKRSRPSPGPRFISPPPVLD